MSAVLRSLLAILVAGFAAVAPAAMPTPSAVTAPLETLDYGLFGALHVARPNGRIAHTVLLVSDRDGWTTRQDGLARALAARGAFVVGIDLPAYLRRMEGIGDRCAYPAAHFEEVAHWVERHEGLDDYAAPLVVGDGAGATFAYAMTAQAPAGTFEGLMTLGWDPGLRFPKLFCTGDAGAMTVAAANGGVQIMPVAHLPLPWVPQPFAAGARIEGLGGLFAAAWRQLGILYPPLALASPAASIGSAYASWRRAVDAASIALPDDVADLPLTDVPVPDGVAAATPPRIALIITGDGGWAGLDRGVADALGARGLHVVGFSTLKFFWQKQTADASAQAIARVIAHYGERSSDASFVVIGYSFGASLVPVVINRLPDALRARVEEGVMISPDDEAVFEIHVGDWFGSTHHDEALALEPEVAASKVPLLCIHGADESDSFCLKPHPALLREIALPGGHHYDGNYEALGTLIAGKAAAIAPR